MKSDMTKFGCDDVLYVFARPKNNNWENTSATETQKKIAAIMPVEISGFQTPDQHHTYGTPEDPRHVRIIGSPHLHKIKNFELCEEIAVPEGAE